MPSKSLPLPPRTDACNHDQLSEIYSNVHNIGYHYRFSRVQPPYNKLTLDECRARKCHVIEWSVKDKDDNTVWMCCIQPGDGNLEENQDHAHDRLMENASKIAALKVEHERLSLEKYRLNHLIYLTSLPSGHVVTREDIFTLPGVYTTKEEDCLYL
jgi:hypothetical protein